MKNLSVFDIVFLFRHPLQQGDGQSHFERLCRHARVMLVVGAEEVCEMRCCKVCRGPLPKNLTAKYRVYRGRSKVAVNPAVVRNLMARSAAINKGGWIRRCGALVSRIFARWDGGFNWDVLTFVDLILAVFAAAGVKLVEVYDADLVDLIQSDVLEITEITEV